MSCSEDVDGKLAGHLHGPSKFLPHLIDVFMAVCQYLNLRSHEIYITAWDLRIAHALRRYGFVEQPGLDSLTDLCYQHYNTEEFRAFYLNRQGTTQLPPVDCIATYLGPLVEFLWYQGHKDCSVLTLWKATLKCKH